MEVKKVVERFAQDKGDRDIWAPLVFHAKPDIKHIFSNPFNANYEKNLASVTACCNSPFVKRVFLTSSLDGVIRLYDVLNHRPIASFEPAINEYLLDVEWSPFRPSVFAAVSNEGSIYIFDLVQSNKSPVQTLKHPDPGAAARHKGARRIRFNPRQRDFIAVSYLDGYARVY